MSRPQRRLRMVAVLPIRVYRHVVSPLLPPACRFYPSCSRYAEDAVLTHGIARGMWLGARRLLRCHPWSQSEVDEVPSPSR